MGGTLKSIVCDHLLQEEVDECMSDPCANGATCIDGLASVTCQCAAGFTGLFCDVSSKIVGFSISIDIGNGTSCGSRGAFMSILPNVIEYADL